MKNLFKILDNIWQASVLMVLILTCLVVAFGDIVFLEPFYAIPIALASWYGSRKSGIFLTLLSFIVLILAKMVAIQNHDDTKMNGV